MLSASVNIPKRTFGVSYTSSKELSLPQSWEQAIPMMRGRRFKRTWSEFVLRGDMLSAHVTFINKIMKGYYQYATPLDIDEMIMAMPWMSMDIKDQELIGNPIRSKLVLPGYGTMKWCKAHGENMTLREFIYIDDFLGHHAKEDSDAKYNLLATICRPVCKDIDAVLKREDVRIPIVSRDQIRMFGARIKRYDKWWMKKSEISFQMAGALLFTLYMKKFVSERYISRLNSGDPSGQNKNNVDFGWHTIAQNVGKSGPFGDVNAVYNTNIHDLCTYLINEKQAHDRMMEK